MPITDSISIVIIIPVQSKHNGQKLLMTNASWNIKYPLNAMPIDASMLRGLKFFDVLPLYHI